MNEDAIDIWKFLPLNYKTQQEDEYLKFLWDSFQTNYENEKYQFAYIAYHMLFMATVYFKIWQIKTLKLDDFKKALIGFSKDKEKELLESTSPFTFSTINESSSFRFLKIINVDNSLIGKYAKLVRDRNDVAHSNGNVFFNEQDAIDAKILEINSSLNEIQSFFETILKTEIDSFLKNNGDETDWEFDDIKEQVSQILIFKNYFSSEDIEFIKKIDLASYESLASYETISSLYEFITNEYLEADE
ncbi:hypothetical protein BVX95_02000 [archaeon D22]|nr:hypothetical protein BVX95_02000 [archaeon D22]